MHPACSPAQTQRAQMFSFLSCEGEDLQSLLIKAQHGRAVNSTAVKERRKRKEKEKRKGKQRQRQSRDKDKDGEREREQERERERERESDGRASEFVARRMLSVGPAGSVNIPYGSRYLATTLYVTKRADHQQNSRYVKEREKGGSAGGEIRTGDLFRSIVPTGDTLTTGLRKGMC